MSLAARILSSIKWRVTTSFITVLVRFLQAILLARLLSVEIFGVFQYAVAIVTVCAVVADFSLGDAMISRAPETEDQDKAASVLLTMLTILGAVWAAGCTAVILVLDALSLIGPQLCIIMIVLVLARLASVPLIVLQSVCVRAVSHRRMSLLRILQVVIGTVSALVLAMRGYEIWALLVIQVVPPVVVGIGLGVWRPVWRLRFGWDPAIARYLLRFGLPGTVATFLSRLLDRLDNIWVGGVLGDAALGLYSRAFKFALYPSTLLSPSINVVSQGAYAELMHDRKMLSQAFFRSTAVLLRAGFLFTGIIAVTAPEFVVLLIGRKWLPMVPSLWCLVLFSLLYPIRQTLNTLFLAVGRPGVLVRARVAQMVVLTAGLAILVPVLKIEGAAIAASTMTLVGIVIFIKESRQHVDCTISRLIGGPVVAAVAAAVVSLSAPVFVPQVSGPVPLFVFKAGLFAGVYAILILIFERRDMLKMLRQARPHGGAMFSMKH